MSASSLVDAIQRSLSPRMTDRGFGAGRLGRSPDGSPSFLYCIGAQEFAARWPETVGLLGAHTEVKLDRPEWCLDFVVEASPAGQLTRLDFEFVDLEVILRSAAFADLAHRCSIDELRTLSGDEIPAAIVEAVDLLMPLAHGR